MRLEFLPHACNDRILILKALQLCLPAILRNAGRAGAKRTKFIV